jgi:hypothetical protein
MSDPEIMPDSLKSLQKEIEDWGKSIEDRELIRHAATCGANNFSPGMLPRLWQGTICNYRTPVYKEAFMAGFYSAACWFLLDRLTQLMCEYPLIVDDNLSRELKLDQMWNWYGTLWHTEQEYRRVPCGTYFIELMKDAEEDNSVASEEDSAGDAAL